MAIRCEFIDLIVPIEKIDLVYPGGFRRFKEQHASSFQRRAWHDQHLYRDGAMDPMCMEQLVKEWERMGLTGVAEVNGRKQWLDFCVVEGLFGGPTLPCEWLEFDPAENCVYLRGKPKGELVGPPRAQA